MIRRSDKGSALTHQELDANFNPMDRTAPVVLTLNAGAITITEPGSFGLEPQTGLTGSLTAINGGTGRMWILMLYVNTVGRTITVVHNPPNLRLGASTRTLDSIHDTIWLQNRSGTIWTEVNFMSIPA